MSYWFAYKKHFIKKNENIISIQNTYIKINKQHSDNLDNNQKIKVSINEIFKLEKEENNYYLVFNKKNKNLNKNINNDLSENKNLNNNKKRKRIAILFSGQMRTNSLGINISNNDNIINSISKYILNDELKNKYDYDVFISTDNAQIHKCKDFFGNNLKNIHCFDINYLMNNVENKITSYNKLFHLYVNRNYNNYRIYPNTVWQFYRLYDCYNMMCNYESINNYDYIIRARLDTVFKKNIVPKIEELDNNINIHYFGAADMFGIGRIGIMEYYSTMINEKYGTFGEGHKIPDELRWKYAPEYQLHFCLNEYCKLNNINPSVALHSIANSVNDFCPIYR
jgi:hypothetical protein